MPNFSRNEVILVRYPFTDLSGFKVRPAVVVSAPHSSQDKMIVPLTSQTAGLQAGEFKLDDWQQAGLNVPTVLKRGVFTVNKSVILKTIGQLSSRDSEKLNHSLTAWLGLKTRT